MKRKRGRPPKENLLEGIANLETGEVPQVIPTVEKTTKTNFNITTAELTFWTGYSGAQISDLKSQGVIEQKGISAWPALATLSALLKRLKQRQQQFSSQDKARRLKAQANSAELDALEAGKLTCLMSQAKQYWSDNRIAVRQTIERAEYISKEHRERLLKEIAAMGPIALQRMEEEQREREAAKAKEAEAMEQEPQDSEGSDEE